MQLYNLKVENTIILTRIIQGIFNAFRLLFIIFTVIIALTGMFYTFVGPPAVLRVEPPYDGSLIDDFYNARDDYFKTLFPLSIIFSLFNILIIIITSILILIIKDKLNVLKFAVLKERVTIRKTGSKYIDLHFNLLI